MQVEAVAAFVDERFRHEGGVQAVPRGKLLDERAEHDHTVGGNHGAVIADIHLYLAGGIFGIGLLDGDSHLGKFAAHRAEHGFQLGGTRQPVAVIALVARTARIRVQKIEFELCSHLQIDAHGVGALDLAQQRLARIDRQRAVIHPLGAGKAHRHARLPRHSHRWMHRKDMAIGKPVGKADDRRFPDIAGHVHGEQRHRQRVAGAADPRPLVCGNALATHQPVQVTNAQNDGMCSFGKGKIHFGHD